MADIVTRLPGFLRPDAARTVLRPFIVEDPSTSDCPRTRRIIDGILALDDAELRDQLKVLAAGLKNRHRDVDRLLRRRYEELSGLMTDRAPATPDQCQLIGAYFSEEFSFESAALFNPSVVPHPDQANVDAGGGYTYFNPKTGQELSGVLGFTYNMTNPSTQYQNGVDMHFDWGASQFVTKQLQLGLVGYAYKDIGCDGGSGDLVGCFQSQVLGVGPQVGYIFPIGGLQGYLNLKAYGEFAGEDRPTGWNAWLTFVLSPAAPAPAAPPRSMITK